MDQSKQILLINGPNLQRLGTREPTIYGTETLQDIVGRLRKTAEAGGYSLVDFQSNSESDIIDFVNLHRHSAFAIIFNPGALMMAGWSLRECLVDVEAILIEVHLSNLYKRESFRHKSVFFDIATGIIAGLGPQSYSLALEYVKNYGAQSGKP
jgi:3-dehydroquinate dehydratase type II